jgi:phytoene synthase
VREFGLTRAHFDALLDGIERDVSEPRHPNAASLERYCEAVAASLAMLCLEILGATSEAEARYAWDVAVALQLANVLRDVADDAARGHIYLPQDALREAGVAEQDVLTGRWSPGFAQVCANLCAHARDLIAGGRELLPPESRRVLLVPEIWADVYLALLDELERIDFRLFSQRPYLRRRTKVRIAARRVAKTMVATRPRIFPGTPTMW